MILTIELVGGKRVEIPLPETAASMRAEQIGKMGVWGPGDPRVFYPAHMVRSVTIGKLDPGRNQKTRSVSGKGKAGGGVDKHVRASGATRGQRGKRTDKATSKTGSDAE